MLPEIGEEGQKRLMNSSALIVGAGGLGCPVCLYLAGAGIGHLGIADADTVSESNLHRQLLYGYGDLGMPKVEAARRRLEDISPETVFTPYRRGLTADNAADIISQYDLVVDCCDNYATRYLISDTCRSLHKPWVFGSIQGFQGMASTFLPGSTTAYDDLYPDRDELAARKPASGGVIGPTPGVIGSIEAAEALRILTGGSPALSSKLLTINLLSMDFQLLNI